MVFVVTPDEAAVDAVQFDCRVSVPVVVTLKTLDTVEVTTCPLVEQLIAAPVDPKSSTRKCVNFPTEPLRR